MSYWLRLDRTPEGLRYRLRSSPEPNRFITDLTEREYASLLVQREHHLRVGLPSMLREIGTTLERAFYVEAGSWSITDNRSEICDETHDYDDPDSEECERLHDYDVYDNSFWATSMCELRKTSRSRPPGHALSIMLRGPPDFTHGELSIFFQTNEQYADAASRIQGLEVLRIEKPSDLAASSPSED